MTNEFERDEYLRVVSMDAQSAKDFFGITDREPVDLGPPFDPYNERRHRPGARVWGFKVAS